MGSSTSGLFVVLPGQGYSHTTNPLNGYSAAWFRIRILVSGAVQYGTTLRDPSPRATMRGAPSGPSAGSRLSVELSCPCVQPAISGCFVVTCGEPSIAASIAAASGILV